MKRYITKLLSVLLAVVLIVGLLPATALAAEEYNVWVSGVQVTDSNRYDVLGDGTVAFTPAAGSEQAKLKLYGANITGTSLPKYPDDNYGIYSEIDLTLELHGASTVTGKDASRMSDGISLSTLHQLTVTGSGTLEVTAGKGQYSTAVSALTMTMLSGTVRATGGKGSVNSSGVSVNPGIPGLPNYEGLVMKGGTLIAEAGEGPDSWGISGIVDINSGAVTAIGQTGAFNNEPVLYDYADPVVTVNTEPSATGAASWNGTDALGGDSSSFRYVKVVSCYPVWVGGVRVDPSNTGDVLGDGTVVFTPATESKPAKLTLNHAKISGASIPDRPSSGIGPDDSVGIYSEIDLILELQGDSTVTAKDVSRMSDGISLSIPHQLTVTGSGTLEVTAGKGQYSSAITAVTMTMLSGTVRATGGKGSVNSSGVSVNPGIPGLPNYEGLVMKGGTLIAEAGESPRSRGICGDATIKGGTVIATGQTRAFDEEPDLSGYADPAVTVNTESSETGAKAWNGTDALGGSGSSYKYVSVAPAMLKNPFIDVAEGAYYYDAVLWAVNATPQVTSGTSYNTFSPNATCTRAQVVTFLWRAKGCPEPEMDAASSLFTDVPEGSYYYKAVLWAVENKITNGTSTTTFSPNMGCTRGQVVTFLHRFAGAPAPSGGANPFTDVAEGTYYYDAVLWAVEKGITKGTSATTFSPNATCTRGQIVTFLYRAMK